MLVSRIKHICSLKKTLVKRKSKKSVKSVSAAGTSETATLSTFPKRPKRTFNSAWKSLPETEYDRVVVIRFWLSELKAICFYSKPLFSSFSTYSNLALEEKRVAFHRLWPDQQKRVINYVCLTFRSCSWRENIFNFRESVLAVTS